ncbi:MAG: TrkH family potassium uptake protein [Gammaproteobacteria bacterium]|nr:TrkH family potassium uptake protein [Gammaproteobacteria bacterium]
MAFSVAFAMPIGLALTQGDSTLWAFALSLFLNFVVGAALWAGSRRFRRELKPRDGYVLVALVWIVLAATAAVPLLLTVPGLSFTDAYFETTSGFTTTGATVLSGLDQLPEPINLWRAELNWLGGLGIIGLAMAVLPLLGVGGMQVYRAEATGPIKDTRLTPRLAQTARSLWLIYSGLTVACILSLRAAGMGWFDAVCHAFSVLSLGGFSPHDASIGYFNSPAIEGVLEFFMLAAGINFATHFMAWRGKSLSAYRRDREAMAFLALVLGSALAVGAYIFASGVYPDFFTALRHTAFNLISIATDCGFVSVNYDRWPLAASLWMLLLSCLSASAGSTGGGIKMIRTMTLFRQAGREIKSLVHPSAVSTLKIGGQVISERLVSAVLTFIHLYIICVVVLTFLLIVSGLDFLSAFSAVIATINNAGPGLHLVGPAANYAGLTDFQTWVCAASMLVGRLEIFVLIVPLTPAFWRE